MFAPALAPTIFRASPKSPSVAPQRGRTSEPVRLPTDPRQSSERTEMARRLSGGTDGCAATR